MLDTLRRNATGFLGIILIGLLVLSFAIWGIEDVFRGIGRGSLAKVGGQEITEREFQQEFQRELNNLSQRAGQALTSEQARAIGLDRQVLARLINAAAIEEHARELDLAVSDRVLADELKNDPTFQGLDGKFSRERFLSVLRQVGLSEQRLLQLRRQDVLRDQITGAFTNATQVPDQLIDILHRWRGETRTIEYFDIDPAKIPATKAPDEATAKAYFEERKTRYKKPEYRKIAVLVMTIDDLKKRAAISDETIKQAFEQTKDRYGTPERRRVLQIPYPDKAAAEAAKKAIEGGKSFADAAKDAGAKDSDLDLGLLRKNEFIDAKVADAAFALKKDEVSDVVEGRFSNVLLRVTEIEDGKEAKFEEVKDKVRDELAGEYAANEIQKLYDDVDDARGAGKTLKEIGESLQLPFHELAAVDRENKTPDDKKALDVENASSIISGGFDAQVGVEREPVELGNDGFAWVDVLDITPSAERSFEAVRDKVDKDWVADEERKALSKFAADLVKRIKDGEAFETAAAAAGGKVGKSEPVTRTGVIDALNRAVITQAFVLAKDAVSSADSVDGKSRTIFRIVGTGEAKAATEDDVKRIRNELKQQYETDTVEAYVAGLRQRLGVSIDEQAFRRLTGADDTYN